MNKRQAEKQGYTFHGAYSHNKEEMKRRAKEERVKGNKAIVIDIDYGYAVYHIISDKNKIATEHERLCHLINNLENRKTRLLDDITEIDKQIAEVKIKQGEIK